MTDKDLQIAKTLKARLSDSVELIDLRVYGSRARGEANEESDMDVFIEVIELTKETKEKILDIVLDVCLENEIYIQPLIFTKYELEETPMRSSFIVQNIFEEGIKI